jgi:predicted RNase H-like nuclease
VTVLGVDGCKGGWIAVAWNGDLSAAPEARVVARFEEIIAMDAEIIAVDIPIGLPDIARHGRGCDGEARRRLKGKASSVFPAPARATLKARNHGEASTINRKFSDPSHGISAQAYNILAKISEVDDLISPLLQSRIHEVHPELCFYAMNGDVSVREKKREADGQEKRVELLQKNGFPFDRMKPPMAPRRHWGLDDLIDACACAWSARRIRDGLNLRLLADPPLDGRGLRMEINA